MTKTLRRVFRYRQLYVLILPAFIFTAIFSYVPMYGVLIAFKNFRANLGVLGSPWVGLAHFERFIRYPQFWQLIRNTLVLSVYSLATFPCAVILALMLNELRSPAFKRTVQMVTYAPYFISTVVICSMITLFTNRSVGIINNMLEFVGASRIDFMTRPDWFAHIYVWSGVWQGVGFGSIIYLAALSGVSPELHEAARIDGATRMNILWHINLPAILPTIVIMLILSCGSVLSVGFDKVFLLQNPLNLDVSEVISTYTYRIGIQGAQYSYSSAIGLLNTVVNVIVLMAVNMIAKKASDISIW